MKVLLGAASHAGNLSGIQRYALTLVRCLLRQPELTALHLVIAPWQQRLVQEAGIDCDRRLHVHLAQMRPNPLSRNFWYYRRLPQLVAGLGVDLVHLTYPVPCAPALGWPVAMTLHDLYPYEIPENFGFPKSVVNRLILRQCLRQADAIVCVSDSTRLRLADYAPPAVARKATRIYNCVEAHAPNAAPAPLRRWRDAPFLVCVAQHRRNKNLLFLLRTFDRLRRGALAARDMKLLIIGIAGRESRTLRRQVSRLDLVERVVFVEGLPEDGLQWCYRTCEAVLAPSLTEGFGLPVAEARLAGCRVVCSDIPAHREVGDGACRFAACDAGSESTFARAIAEALQMPKPGSAAFPEFSAPVLGRQYIRLYHQLLAGGRVRGERPGVPFPPDRRRRRPPAVAARAAWSVLS